jgi:hypothetical protein
MGVVGLEAGVAEEVDPEAEAAGSLPLLLHRPDPQNRKRAPSRLGWGPLFFL